MLSSFVIVGYQNKLQQNVWLRSHAWSFTFDSSRHLKPEIRVSSQSSSRESHFPSNTLLTFSCVERHQVLSHGSSYKSTDPILAGCTLAQLLLKDSTSKYYQIGVKILTYKHGEGGGSTNIQSIASWKLLDEGAKLLPAIIADV